MVGSRGKLGVDVSLLRRIQAAASLEGEFCLTPFVAFEVWTLTVFGLDSWALPSIPLAYRGVALLRFLGVFL